MFSKCWTEEWKDEDTEPAVNSHETPWDPRPRVGGLVVRGSRCTDWIYIALAGWGKSESVQCRPDCAGHNAGILNQANISTLCSPSVRTKLKCPSETLKPLTTTLKPRGKKSEHIKTTHNFKKKKIETRHTIKNKTIASLKNKISLKGITNCGVFFLKKPFK